MKKLFVLATLFLVASIFPQHTAAYQTHAEPSARLNYTFQKKNDSDARVVALRNILRKYRSPLEDYAHIYVQHADLNQIDWKLLPSISGIESTFGKHYVSGSYNVYGWGGGYIYFTSWEDGIDTISKALREKYVDRGADTIYKMARIYAPPSTRWAPAVTYFTEEINREYLKFISDNLSPTI